MTLEDFYFISQIIAAVGIMASLVFVGLQMRAQARETRLASMAEVMSEYRNAMGNLSNNRHLVVAMLECEEVGWENLEMEKFFPLGVAIASLLRVFEQAYIYRYEGKIDDRTWTSMKGMMSASFRYRGAFDYFEARRETFTQVFIDFVESEFADELAKRRAIGLSPTPTREEAVP